MAMGVNCRAWGNEASLVGALRVTRKKIWPRRPFPRLIDFNGAPERIRTSDPQIRSLVLYPAELRAPVTESFSGETEGLSRNCNGF